MQPQETTFGAEFGADSGTDNRAPSTSAPHLPSPSGPMRVGGQAAGDSFDSTPNQDRSRSVRREQPADVAGIAREQYVSGPGNDGDVSIADIRSARATTELTHP